MPPPPPPPLAAAKANRAALRLAVACLLLAVTWLLAVGRTVGPAAAGAVACIAPCCVLELAGGLNRGGGRAPRTHTPHLLPPPHDPQEMGSAGSKAEGSGSAQGGWQPGAPGQPRIYSASGFDITPLTTEERIEAARGLTDFQRYVTLQVRPWGAVLGCAVLCCADVREGWTSIGGRPTPALQHAPELPLPPRSTRALPAARPAPSAPSPAPRWTARPTTTSARACTSAPSAGCPCSPQRPSE